MLKKLWKEILNSKYTFPILKLSRHSGLNIGINCKEILSTVVEELEM